MRRCTVCTHPERAAIDAALLQRISYRTVAGKHGLSYSALFRHRRRHVDAPTVGDILPPHNRGDAWREWSGTEWRRIDPPALADGLPFPVGFALRKYFIEIRGRPADASWRDGWCVDGSFAFCQKVYRRLRSK